MKICYRRSVRSRGLAQNDSAVELSTNPLPTGYRSPSTATACFEAELHEHRLQLDHQRGRR
ncbi:MAG: hypothetical protein ACKO0M_17600, partial [Cyanobium sp.]